LPFKWDNPIISATEIAPSDIRSTIVVRRHFDFVHSFAPPGPCESSMAVLSHIPTLRPALSGCVLLLMLLGASPAFAQATNAPTITSPSPGQILLGQVAIKGTTNIPNFSSAEVAFTYPSDPTNTWFIIKNLTDPVDNDVLATWDTTTLSDGKYILRLRVKLADGSVQDVTVLVAVSNYTAIPTPTLTVTPNGPALQIPSPILVLPSPSSTVTPRPAPFTPTPLPSNPASVTTKDVYAGFWRSALFVVLIFVGYGILIRLRRS
jgi:hypothetical protein